MEEREMEVIEAWNGFITGLMSAKKNWNDLVRAMDNVGNIDHYPNRMQSCLAKVNTRGVFEIVTPRLIDHIRSYTSYEECLIVDELIEEGEKE